VMLDLVQPLQPTPFALGIEDPDYQETFAG
jgi:hypothetical protein